MYLGFFLNILIKIPLVFLRTAIPRFFIQEFREFLQKVLLCFFLELCFIEEFLKSIHRNSWNGLSSNFINWTFDDSWKDLFKKDLLIVHRWICPIFSTICSEILPQFAPGFFFLRNWQIDIWKTSIWRKIYIRRTPKDVKMTNERRQNDVRKTSGRH